jgi:vitamin-K-epoxide reductase (warfarin-sensitive)
MECMKSVLKYAITILALAGLGVSIQALHIHLMDPNAAPPCAVSEHWDCGAVGHSRYSWFPPKSFDEMLDAEPGKLHVPVAALGIAGYVVIAVLALMGRMWLVFELAQVGFFIAAFLSYIEAFILEKWCIYCVWSQIIMTVILLLSAVALLLDWRQRRRQNADAASTAPVVE